MAKKRGGLVSLVPEALYSRIYVIRNHKVMLDFHLAELYEVETRVLNQAVKRSLARFPADFMFQVNAREWKSLRSQFVILDGRGKHSKYRPYAFTEQGVSMLSSVLNSPRAVAINIQIMRLFVKMRQLISGHKELVRKIEKLEKAQLDSSGEIASIYRIIKGLLEPSLKNRPAIGFKISGKDGQN